MLDRCLALFAVGVLTACGNSPPGSADANPPGNVTPLPIDAGVAPDASMRGPLTTVDQDYDFGRITVSDEQTGNTYETDIHGYVRYPDDAPGPLPVLLFLHGRHQTCETTIGQAPVLIADDDTCPDAVVIEPAQSYRGYDYIADNLASHGYVVISVDANDINDSDGSPGNGDAGALARAELVLTHLDAFRTINAQGGMGFDALAGRLDFSAVGLMGHSRGGEGVNKAVAVNRTRPQPFNLDAVFALAPTDYNDQVMDQVTFVSLAGYCDGDVEDLMGNFAFDTARYAATDETRPKFQLIAMGANHNYYNTVWTSDDWEITNPAGDDAHCGMNAPDNGRDTPESQRAHGLFFIASFFRYFIGDEAEFGAIWNGQARLPATACPDETTPCDDRFHLSPHMPSGKRLVIDNTLTDASLSANTLNGGVTYTGFSQVETCATDGRPGNGCTMAEPTFNTAPQLVLAWDGPAVYRSSLGGLDASEFDVLSLRVGVSHGDDDNTAGQDFRIVLEDVSGARASVRAAELSNALFYPPGDDFDRQGGGARKTTLSAVDIPLTAFAEAAAANASPIDVSRLTAVELVFDVTDAGTIQITDLLLQRVSQTSQP